MMKTQARKIYAATERMKARSGKWLSSFPLLIAIVACQDSGLSTRPPSPQQPRPQIQSQSQNNSVGIIGGNEVQATDDPSALSTVGVYDKKNHSTCSGSLIAKDLILTAAHCVNPNSNQLFVLFSKNFYVSGRLNESRMIVARRFERHSSFNPNRAEGVDTFDLALIQLSSPAPAEYRTIPLSQDTSHVFEGVLIAAGYGFTNGLLRKGLGTLRQASLQFLKPHSKTEFETLQDSTGVCSGDSGGPLYQKLGSQWLQVGVASRVATKFLGCRKYAVYTRVDSYQDWIQETAQKLRSSP
jgi:secreted trypsin-like serine protease